MHTRIHTEMFSSKAGVGCALVNRSTTTDPEEAFVFVEVDVVEQRTEAVYEVLDAADVVEVARRYGVCRQTVHTWLRKYANEGFSSVVDKSSKPDSCPHQIPAVVEARVVEMRRPSRFIRGRWLSSGAAERWSSSSREASLETTS
jgi:transposase-like protein